MSPTASLLAYVSVAAILAVLVLCLAPLALALPASAPLPSPAVLAVASGGVSRMLVPSLTPRGWLSCFQ